MDPKEILEVKAEIDESAEELVEVLFSTMATTMKVKHKVDEDQRREEEKEQRVVLQALTMVGAKDLRDREQLLPAVVLQEELVDEEEKIREIGKMMITMMMIKSLAVEEKEGESPKEAREVLAKKVKGKRARKAKMTTRIFLLAFQLARTVRKEAWRLRKRTP